MNLTPRVGFSMHPRWAFGEGLRSFLEPLRRAGLAALEFELNNYDSLWPQFAPLIDDCRQLGFELCFHAPYRPPHSFAGFAGRSRSRIIAAQKAMYELAASLGPVTVVVHGARSETRSLPHLVDDTVRFVEWVLHDFPNLTLALENLNHRTGFNRVGESEAQLLDMVEQFNHPRLTICWDVGHHVMAGNTAAPPVDWLKRVGHVHIHDLDPSGLDHLPFIYGRVVPGAWLSQLPDTFAGIVTLELNGQRCAFLWPDRMMPALTNSVAAIRDILRSQDRGQRIGSPGQGTSTNQAGGPA